jgi:hypothetical protein
LGKSGGDIHLVSMQPDWLSILSLQRHHFSSPLPADYRMSRHGKDVGINISNAIESLSECGKVKEDIVYDIFSFVLRTSQAERSCIQRMPKTIVERCKGFSVTGSELCDEWYLHNILKLLGSPSKGFSDPSFCLFI